MVNNCLLIKFPLKIEYYMVGNWLLLFCLDPELKLSSEWEEEGVSGSGEKVPQSPGFFHPNLSRSG